MSTFKLLNSDSLFKQFRFYWSEFWNLIHYLCSCNFIEFQIQINWARSPMCFFLLFNCKFETTVFLWLVCCSSIRRVMSEQRPGKDIATKIIITQSLSVWDYWVVFLNLNYKVSLETSIFHQLPMFLFRKCSFGHRDILKLENILFFSLPFTRLVWHRE